MTSGEAGGEPASGMPGRNPRLSRAKAELRARCKTVRAGLKARVDPAPALRHLDRVLAGHAGRIVAAYLPIGSEMDPQPALAAAAARGPLCLPVVHGRDRPLTFRAWRPGAALAPGGFGTQVPAAGAVVTPEVLVVPCLAFDAAGHRLGYGAGHYDRTLEALRAKAPVLAVGLAYAGQQVGDLPSGPHDQPLDLIVTEAGPLRPRRPG